MPLPPALAARLAQRGLISASHNAIPSHDAEEEVFAEDYDDQKVPQKGESLSRYTEDASFVQEDIQRRIKGYPGCPNKSNIYHECSKYCLDKYGKGFETPDPKYLKQKSVLLIKYPLPEGWDEVYDPGTGRHYYWNLATDTVSWLPPGHPKHAASEPACVLREEVKLAESDEEEDDSESEAEKSPDDDEEEARLKDKRTAMIKAAHAKGRSAKKENDLDPMDPAAYSEAPRGTWASGLQGDVNTGVDSTAAGSIYQQRPLASPGDILRAQKKARK